MNMPSVPVVDIEVKGNDLVIATNGRGFWIMDDISPLRASDKDYKSKNAHLFPINPHTRFGYIWWMDYLPGGNPGNKKNYFVQNMRPGLTYYEKSFTLVNGERKRQFIDAGDPKPLGVVMYFSLNGKPSEIALQIEDAEGNVLRNYTEKDMVLNTGTETGNPLNKGLNKFVWDMRMNRVTSVPKRPATAISPIVPPGTYTASLTVDGEEMPQSFQVYMNPKENYTQAQADEKFAFWMDIYNHSEAWTQDVIAALKTKEEVNKQLETFINSGASERKIKKAKKRAAEVAAVVDNYEGTFVSTGRTLAEVINLPATILFKMSFISGILDHSEGPPANSMKLVFADVVIDANKAKEQYHKDITPALEKFEKAIEP
jgi:hypothetical protein